MREAVRLTVSSISKASTSADSRETVNQRPSEAGVLQSEVTTGDDEGELREGWLSVACLYGGVPPYHQVLSLFARSIISTKACSHGFTIASGP